MNPDFYEIPEGYVEIPQDQLRQLIDMVGGDAPNLTDVLDKCDEYEKAGIATKILWDQQSYGIILRADVPSEHKKWN